jgi:hypothetical protein
LTQKNQKVKTQQSSHPAFAGRQAHKAGRWPAAASAHRALPINVLSEQLNFNRNSRIFLAFDSSYPDI